MDNKRAKFILQSYRSNGSDAEDSTFKEALALAARDRELGEWLAEERAYDALFAETLAEVEIPEDLREAIFEVLEGVQDEPAEFDADFVGALAGVKPPKGLRDQILGAMEVEQKVVELSARRKRSIYRKVMWAGSAAAVIAVMVGVAAFFAGAGGGELAGSTPQEVEMSAIKMMESPFFSLDLTNERQASLYEWLNSKNLPTPDDLPPGLVGVKGVGCKFIEIGEQKSRASLICFRKEDHVVHLVVMDRQAMDFDGMSKLENAVAGCRGCPENEDWAMTRWADERHSYFLLAKMEPGELAALFENVS